MNNTSNDILDGKTVLITGGTGSFGKKFIEVALKEYNPRKVIVFSRDELKQHEMRQDFPESSTSPMRYFIGDVRELGRLMRAFEGVDYVIHAAALKQVPTCEYNPFEAVKTNILGGKNIIDAAIDCRVKKVVALSTDKAVNPVNLYGATKLCAEKMFVQANVYSGDKGTAFAVTRYGNVVGSRGSVVPLFQAQKSNGCLTVTDPRMTRFWITLEQGVRFVIKCLGIMKGGEIFVPKIPSMNIMELARAVAPGCPTKSIGIRPGEKLHEALISEHESRDTCEYDGMYIIRPAHAHRITECRTWECNVPEGFTYTSDGNSDWLRSEDILPLLESLLVSHNDLRKA